MEHGKQVEILKALMQQLDEENIDAGVSIATKPRRMFVLTGLLKKRIFKNHPQLIGLSGDLPEKGSYLALDDFGVPILATRDKDGQFRAFLNACRHRGARLASEPKGRASVFMCPFLNGATHQLANSSTSPMRTILASSTRPVADSLSYPPLSTTDCCLFTQTKMAS